MKTSNKSLGFPPVPDASCFEMAWGRSPGGSGKTVACGCFSSWRKLRSQWWYPTLVSAQGRNASFCRCWASLWSWVCSGGPQHLPRCCDTAPGMPASRGLGQVGTGSEGGLGRGSGGPLFLQWPLSRGSRPSFSRGRRVVDLSLGYRKGQIQASSLFRFPVYTSLLIMV